MLLRPGLPPSGGRWSLELKWDGMRAQLRVSAAGSWCVRSRPGRDCTNQFPELAALAEELRGHDVVLDGELVCLAADGRPDFQRLRRRLSARDDRAAAQLARSFPATLMVFDILHFNGRAVRWLPQCSRAELLRETLPSSGHSWRTPAPLSGPLDAVLDVTRAHELEGIVAKRLDAPYAPGRRSGAWLKHKHRQRETFAVTGWRSAPPHARRPDAILVARAAPDGGLLPAGSAELGLSGNERDRLRSALAQLHTDTRRGTHRVAAGIWLDIDYHGARGGPLRDAVMRAVRVDA
jgi:bifunctional non-homologous end joining protein LigD